MNIPIRFSRNQRRRTGGETYEIVVEAKLGSRWSEWFEGFELVELEDGRTSLRGSVADQAALFGALGRIRDLGVTLVSVHRLDDAAELARTTPDGNGEGANAGGPP